MKIWIHAKNLIFVSLFIFGNPLCWAKEPPSINIPCGKYKLSGFLTTNNQKMLILSFSRSVSLPAEFIILTNDAKKLIDHVGEYITFEGEVPKPILSNNKPFVILKKLLPTDTSREAKFKKIEDLKCSQN